MKHRKIHPDIYYLEDVFPLQEFYTLNDEMVGHYNVLSLKRESYTSEAQPFWYAHYKPGDGFGIGDNAKLLSASPYITYLIKKILKPKFDFFLRRVNTNIQQKFQDSSFHQDGYDGEHGPKWTWTFLLFSEVSWNTEWGGEFVCAVGDGEYKYVTYKPGSCVLFNGHLDHKGCAPNNFAMGQRSSIAWTYTAVNDIPVFETSYNNNSVS